MVHILFFTCFCKLKAISQHLFILANITSFLLVFWCTQERPNNFMPSHNFVKHHFFHDCMSSTSNGCAIMYATNALLLDIWIAPYPLFCCYKHHYHKHLCGLSFIRTPDGFFRTSLALLALGIVLCPCISQKTQPTVNPQTFQMKSASVCSLLLTGSKRSKAGQPVLTGDMVCTLSKPAGAGQPLAGSNFIISTARGFPKISASF